MCKHHCMNHEKCVNLTVYEKLAYHYLFFLLNKIFYKIAPVKLLELSLDGVANHHGNANKHHVGTMRVHEASISG